jgi:hypothetical protein
MAAPAPAAANRMSATISPWPPAPTMTTSMMVVSR